MGLTCVLGRCGLSDIWHGGICRSRLILRSQVSTDERGRLLYYGRVFGRQSWPCDWQPPKFIRLQGRSARGQFNPLNTYPVDAVEIEDEKRYGSGGSAMDAADA